MQGEGSLAILESQVLVTNAPVYRDDGVFSVLLLGALYYLEVEAVSDVDHAVDVSNS